MKRAIVCTVLAAMVAGGAEAETSDTQKAVPAVSSIATNLGVQVERAMMMRSDIGLDENGKHVLYTVLMGAPAVLVRVDLASGEVLGSHPLANTSGAWAVHVAPDQTVYVGAYNRGLLYHYFPKSGELKNLGKPFKTEDAVLYPMAFTPEGKVYGGSYSSGHAYEYDPKTEKFRDLGDMTTTTAEERWIRVTAYDPKTNRLYFGIGNQAQLVEYDLATGKKRNLLGPRYADITSVYDMNVEGGRLFCRKETHNPNEYFVLDQASGNTVPVTNADTGETSLTFINASRGLSPKSPVANKMYYIGLDRHLHEYDLDTNTIRSLKAEFPSVATGFKWVKLNDPNYPGWTLAGTTGNAGDIYKYNLQTGRYETHAVKYPGQPINIHDIETGPDGRVYSGGYLAGNMGVFDPATSTVTHLSGSGQTEGLVFVGRKLYMGVYPTARIFEYDTTRPWNPGSVWIPSKPGSRNPDQIFSLESNPDVPSYTNQDRPFAMAGSEQLSKLFVGTVPKNGMLGGALAIWDVSGRSRPDVHWNIMPDQSIVTLVYKDGLLYGGTSIYGGMGSTPTTKQGQLFVWDVAKSQVVFKMVPAPNQPAITQLAVGPDKMVWGLAGGYVFAFDPESRKVVYGKDLFPGVKGRLRDGSLISGQDGILYGVAGSKVFRLDPVTKALDVIATGADKLAVGHDGRLYVVGDPITNLYQLTVPGKTEAEAGAGAGKR